MDAPELQCVDCGRFYWPRQDWIHLPACRYMAGIGGRPELAVNHVKPEQRGRVKGVPQPKVITVEALRAVNKAFDALPELVNSPPVVNESVNKPDVVNTPVNTPVSRREKQKLSMRRKRAEEKARRAGPASEKG